MHLGDELRFLDLPAEDRKGQKHDPGDHGKIAGVAHQRVPDGAGGKGHAKTEDQNATCAAHQIDDCVCLGTERLDRHVRHQGDRRAAEGGHGHQGDQQQDHKQDQRYRVVLRDLPGVGVARRNDVVRIVGVGDGFAVLLDLASDRREGFQAELLAQNEFLAVRALERRVLLLGIDLGQSGGVVDRGEAAELLELGVVHEAQADQDDGRDDGAKENEGRAAAQPVAAAV